MPSRYEQDYETGAITSVVDPAFYDDDPSRRVRVLIALDVTASQAANVNDLLATIHARLCDDAGRLDGGNSVVPIALILTTVGDTGPLDAATLRDVYEVGIQ